MKNPQNGVISPYRALGCVCDSSKLHLQKRGNQNFIVSSVDSAFHIYNVSRLRLVSIGTSHPYPIRALETLGDTTFVASGMAIFAWKRGKLVGRLEGHMGEINLLMTFGNHILSLCAESRTILIHDAMSFQVFDSLDFSSSSMDVTAWMHPQTYLNKILLGGSNGEMELWNIKTKKRIHSFQSVGSRVLCMEQSPALHVIGIGLSDGRVLVHNLEFDETVVEFSHKEGDAANSLSFRTDGIHYLVSGSNEGQFNIWNLDKKNLFAVLNGAHSSSIVSCQFLDHEPLLVSSGSDNSIKVWIFDTTDGMPRVLRERSGHALPVNVVRFYANPEAKHILSGGFDGTLRSSSTFLDHQNFAFSARAILGKASGRPRSTFEMTDLSSSSSSSSSLTTETILEDYTRAFHTLPPFVDVVSSFQREREFASIVSRHRDCPTAYSWKFLSKTISHALTIHDNLPVTAISISSCGNHALLGSMGGSIEMFNLQSGISRKKFDISTTTNSLLSNNRPVLSVMSDATNSYVVALSRNGDLSWWEFYSGKHLFSSSLNRLIETIGNSMTTTTRSSPLVSCFHSDSSLLFVGMDDAAVIVIDCDSRRVVRKLLPPSEEMSIFTSIDVSPDCRICVSSGTNSKIVLWDIVTSRVIDSILLTSPPTSVSFSPDGTFLALSINGRREVFLWAMRGILETSLNRVSVVETRSEVLPSAGMDDEDDEDDNIEEIEVQKEIGDEEMEGSEEPSEPSPSPPSKLIKPDPSATDLIRMSGEPTLKWQLIANIAAIKERNRPKIAKEKINAPFFLPTLPGLDVQFVVAQEVKEQFEQQKEQQHPPKQQRSRIMDFGKNIPKSKLMVNLEIDIKQGDDGAVVYSNTSEYLRNLTASGVDTVLRSITYESNFEELRNFLTFLKAQLESNSNFELVQSYLSVVIDAHREVIVENSGILLEYVDDIRSIMSDRWSRLSDLLNTDLCLVGYLSNLPS